jgi:hypothetical protein
MSRLRILISAAIVAATGCSDAPTSVRTVAGLRISTIVDRAKIRPGDTVWVRVVARNVSGGTIRIDDPLLSCALSLEVRGPGPVNYYRGARLCEAPSASARVPAVLAPGDSMVGVAPWPGVTYVSSSGSVLGTQGPAPEGAYEAVGSVWFDHRSWVDGGAARIIVAAP